MTSAGELFVRWRVRLGYPLAIAVLFFARPNPRSILYGALVGIIGLGLRAWAAGYLHKQKILTVIGPYAYTRNPLYLGSAILALGVAVAARSWTSASIIAAYFVIVYSVVMRREEGELRAQHGADFDRYAAAVSLFFPWFSSATSSKSASQGAFSAAQYRKNHEWQAATGFVLLLAVLILIWRLRGS
ncbi:MAG: isoprenylcysteine carboxylmethyltransferase family protein [Candidatus Acidiferrum sp.]